MTMNILYIYVYSGIYKYIPEKDISKPFSLEEHCVYNENRTIHYRALISKNESKLSISQSTIRFS